MHKRNTGYCISYGLPMLPCATYTYMNFIILFPFFPPFSRWGSVALLLRSHMRNKIESHKILNGIQLLCTAMRCSFGQSLHELTAFALFVGLNKWSVAKKNKCQIKILGHEISILCLFVVFLLMFTHIASQITSVRSEGLFSHIYVFHFTFGWFLLLFSAFFCRTTHQMDICWQKVKFHTLTLDK